MVSCGGMGQQGLTEGAGGGGDWQQLSGKVPFGTLLEVTINPTREPAGPRAGPPQAKKLPGREHNPIHQHNWIKALLSKALPRARSSFSHHQSLPSGSLHKPLSLLHRRADKRSKKNHNPAATRTKTTTQKVNQNEKAEGYVPDEGTR